MTEAIINIALIVNDEGRFIIPCTNESREALTEEFGLSIWQVYEITRDHHEPLMGIPFSFDILKEIQDEFTDVKLGLV